MAEKIAVHTTSLVHLFTPLKRYGKVLESFVKGNTHCRRLSLDGCRHSLSPSVRPQVTQKAGRTSLCPETPTTWWEPTVCLCSSTTFKELTQVWSHWLWNHGGIKWRRLAPPPTCPDTHTHTHMYTRTTQWCMKKTQSVLFTAPMDEGRTLTMLFVTRCP